MEDKIHRQWFKFYGQDWLTDMKVRSLSLVDTLAYITILCLASQSKEERFTIKKVQEKSVIALMGLDGQDAKNAVGFFDRLERNGMLLLSRYEDTNCDVTVPRFEERQIRALTNAERQKRFREKNLKTAQRKPVRKSVTKQRYESNEIVTDRGEESRGEEKRGDINTNTNTLAMQASQEDQKFIVEVIDLWAEVFDDKEMVKRWYGNKTQREAIVSLRKRLKSEEKLRELVRHLPDMIQIPYMPKMSTPYMLNANLIDIVAKIKQDGTKAKSKGKGIISQADIT